MSNIIKDLAAILFSAGEELEKKAGEYKETREARQEKFEQKLREQQKEFEEKYQCNTDFMKEKIVETAGKFGLATKDDIEELKNMIRDLSDKIDKNSR